MGPAGSVGSGLVGPAGASGAVGDMVRLGPALRVASIVESFGAVAVFGGGAALVPVRLDVDPPGRDGSGFRSAPDGWTVPDHCVPPDGDVTGIPAAGDVGAPDGDPCPATVVTVNGSDPLLPYAVAPASTSTVAAAPVRNRYRRGQSRRSPGNWRSPDNCQVPATGGIAVEQARCCVASSCGAGVSST
jgi:hypothetical protein